MPSDDQCTVRRIIAVHHMMIRVLVQIVFASRSKLELVRPGSTAAGDHAGWLLQVFAGRLAAACFCGKAGCCMFLPRSGRTHDDDLSSLISLTLQIILATGVASFPNAKKDHGFPTPHPERGESCITQRGGKAANRLEAVLATTRSHHA